MGLDQPTRMTTAAAARATSRKTLRACPRVARANTANRKRNQKAGSDGVRYRKAASAAKSAANGKRHLRSLAKRSATASASARTRNADRKMAETLRAAGVDVSNTTTSEKETRIARARVIWRSKYRRSVLSRYIAVAGNPPKKSSNTQTARKIGRA